ncbi:MAG: hypothetical protein ACRERY_13050, partial [Pseudomonas sp.]
MLRALAMCANRVRGVRQQGGLCQARVGWALPAAALPYKWLVFVPSGGFRSAVALVILRGRRLVRRQSMRAAKLKFSP